MIELDYHLSESWNRVSNLDLAALDEGALRYQAFLGDIVFRVKSADFSANWGWIPILDFAVGLVTIVKRLAVQSSCETFDFTESDAAICFRHADKVVDISASYVNATASVTLLELDDASRRFLTRLAYEVMTRYPVLNDNAAFKRLCDTQMIERA
jgi:hypothetical protein